jgi:hypothetical protein
VADITRFTPFHELPEFLSVEELQAYLASSRNQAYELCAPGGGIKALRFGRLILIPKSVLAERT